MTDARAALSEAKSAREDLLSKQTLAGEEYSKELQKQLAKKCPETPAAASPPAPQPPANPQNPVPPKKVCPACDRIVKQIREIDGKLDHLRREVASLTQHADLKDPNIQRVLNEDKQKISDLGDKRKQLEEQLAKCQESCKPPSTGGGGGTKKPKKKHAKRQETGIREPFGETLARKVRYRGLSTPKDHMAAFDPKRTS